MKKNLLFLVQKIFLLGSVAMLLALYLLRYFTKRKMGMARYMVYFRDKWSGRELGAFSLLQWSVLLTLLLFSLILSFIVIRLFRQSGGRSIGKKAGNTSFSFIPIVYSFFLMLYSFLYFFLLWEIPEESIRQAFWCIYSCKSFPYYFWLHI